MLHSSVFIDARMFSEPKNIKTQSELSRRFFSPSNIS